MHNKMSLALLVATTAILPMSILAAEPEFYVEGHLGYANTQVKTALKGVRMGRRDNIHIYSKQTDHVPLSKLGKTFK